MRLRTTGPGAGLGARSPRFTNLAIIVVSVDLADKAIVDFDFLIFESRAVFHGFMDQDFFDQRVQKLGGQLGGMGAYLTRVTHFPTLVAVSFSFAMAS